MDIIFAILPLQKGTISESTIFEEFTYKKRKKVPKKYQRHVKKMKKRREQHFCYSLKSFCLVLIQYQKGLTKISLK